MRGLSAALKDTAQTHSVRRTPSQEWPPLPAAEEYVRESLAVRLGYTPNRRQPSPDGVSP